MTLLLVLPLFLALGLLALLLRWAFGDDRRPVPDFSGGDLGLLQEVAVAPDALAHALTGRLRRAGIRATTATGPDTASRRVLVFPSDVPDARLVLRDL
ncbi:hypothetical protein [Umezawaea beigongshangensis]|uniref:hypothetical protein n=1 Tax=Umezawaea beigongshangensis TaxID=2780383 RepID=UPI0018F1535C|nr:hypothetical protein [Umezawaea beigongshangensis]